MIELKNISKSYKTKYDEVQVLNNINIKFSTRGLYFIVGKSGVGKSTLLNLIGGLDSPTKGNILYNMEDITNFDKKELFADKIGFVFQKYNLISNMNVLDNILLPFSILKNEYCEEYLDNILKKLDIIDLKKRNINELSAGQQQRVAIARALLKKPEVLLCDEPTGALDESNSKELYKILKSISNDCLVIVVTHDLMNANEYGDHIFEIQNGSISYGDSADIIERDLNHTKNGRHPNSKSVFKIGKSIVFNHKVGLILSLVTIIISTLLLMISVSIADYDKAKTIYSNMNYHNKNIISVSAYDKEDYYTCLNDVLLNNIDNTCVIGYDEDICLNDYINNSTIDTEYKINRIINYSALSIENLELSLIYGVSPEKENEILITKGIYNLFELYGYNDNGYSNQVNEYSDIINKKIGKYTITGIVLINQYKNTDFKKYVNSDDCSKNTLEINDGLSNGLYFSIFINESVDLFKEYKPFVQLYTQNLKSRTVLSTLDGVSYKTINENGDIYISVNDYIEKEYSMSKDAYLSSYIKQYMIQYGYTEEQATLKANDLLDKELDSVKSDYKVTLRMSGTRS